MLKGIAAIALCIQIIASGSVYAIPKSIRQAGIIDDLTDLTQTYKHNNIIIEDNAAKAEKLPASFVYNTKSELKEVYFVVSGGRLEENFNVSVSEDNETYQAQYNASDSGELNMGGEIIYQLRDFPKNQKYIKFDLLDNNIKINQVYINVTFNDPELNKMFQSLLTEAGNYSPSARVITEEDMTLYKQRFMDAYLAGIPNISAYENTLKNDGSWDDIDYSGANGAVSHTHVNRMVDIAKLLSSKEGGRYNDETLKAKLCKVIDYWVEKDVKFVNWYQNKITVPAAFGDTLLCSGELLPKQTEEKARKYLLNKMIETGIDTLDTQVGSNVVYSQMCRVRYALYTNDKERIKLAFDRIAEEITIVTKLNPKTNSFRDRLWDNYVKLPNLPDTREGIQVDYSCLFHGPMLYSGGYGMGFVTELGKILKDVQGTELFPKEAVIDCVNQILEHYRWVTRGSVIDYSTAGRGLAQNNNIAGAKNADSFLRAVKQFSDIPGMHRANELLAYYEKSMGLLEDDNTDISEYPIVSVIASAEPQSDNNALNAIDKSLATRWSSDGDGDTITIDLGKEKAVSAVAIGFHSGNVRTTKFELQLSGSNEEWETVYKGDSTGATAELEYYAFEEKNARYIRLVCHGNSVNEWSSITEVCAFSSIDNNISDGSFKLIDQTALVKRYLEIVQEKEIGSIVDGNKYFWKADYAAHQKDRFLATVKMSSNRTIASEAVNTENLKGDFLSDGCTFFYRTGTEYNDIFAAWDWYKIPGTTTQIRDFEPVSIQHLAIPGSQSDYAGGVSDDKHGAAAMQLLRDGLSAKKAWFMFDREIAALGTDIKNTAKNNYLTTINQSLLKGDVTIGDGAVSRVISNGSHKNQPAQWVHQDSTGYVFFDTQNINIDNQSVTGDRSDINWGGKYVRPDTDVPVTRDIFALWLDHTPKEARKEYSYIVIPGIEPEETKNYFNDNPIRIIENSPKLQAVYHDELGVAQAVFWEEGTVKIFEGLEFSVDARVLLQVSKEYDRIIVAVSSLSASADKVNLIINTPLEGSGAVEVEGTTQVSIQLPSGEYAGKSIVLEFNR